MSFSSSTMLAGKYRVAGMATICSSVRFSREIENKVYQYRWALRHPVAKEAITKALSNRLVSGPMPSDGYVV